MTNNTIYSVENEKFIFLLNDLTAADWVLNVNENMPKHELSRRFMEIHHIFLRRLDRQEKGGLRMTPMPKLVKVVRGWIILYKCTLSLLRKQHPRLSSSRDLVIGKTNWSERLGISASGLLLIDHSSRYAEFWAERAIKTKNGYSSFESRLSFVGSYIYNEYAKMVRNDEWLVLDTFSNGVTSYDMMLFIMERHCTPETFPLEAKKIGWRIKTGNKESIIRVFQIYSKLKEKDYHF